MSGKLFGLATIRTDGQYLETFEGASMDPGGIKRTPRPGARNAGTFTESIEPSKVECEVQFGEGVSIASIQAISDGVITFETDTGQTYVINHGYCADPPQLGGEGKLKCVFQGPPAEEIL